MELYSCSACNNQLYFESYQCMSCSAALGYVEEGLLMTGLNAKDNDLYEALDPGLEGRLYRYCANHKNASCNWLVAAGDKEALCGSCRLTSEAPDLSNPKNLESWANLERAKRRLLYTLRRLELPVESAADRTGGLTFHLLEGTAETPVTTGHADGVITINIAEADDAYRENERVRLGEAYRTMLGHFRHEVGHYYFDRLIVGSSQLRPFRKLFGDERADYQKSLETHYEQGPPDNYEENYVSGYAAMHPWEDWAETWAHYLHIVDTLETAQSYGLRVDTPTGPETQKSVRASSHDPANFDSLMKIWLPVTLALNGLNRSMGLADAYPFSLSDVVRSKLSFVHSVILDSRGKQ